MILLVILLALLALIGLAMPIAFALTLVSIGVLAFSGVDMLVLVQRLYRGTESFPLLAVPLFILAGQIMNHSGISARLVDLARSMVGAIRGGLAAVNILTSMFFAGMSGTSMSDTAAVGGVMIPQMVKRGYSAPFTAAVTASSSTIGIIIPPSVPMVLLSAYMGLSTGALFAAGLVSGLLIAIGLMLMAWWISVKRQYPIEAAFSIRQLGSSLVSAFPALLMPVIILGGILGGIFTPTEASAVAVAYGIFAGMVLYRSLSLRALYRALVESAVLTGAVMFVTAAAHTLGYTFTYQSLGQLVLGPIAALDMGPIGFLLILSIVLIIAGTFLDGIAMMFIVVPLFLPSVQLLGIDPLQFAMVVILCWGIGQQTPPVGAALFITSVISRVDIIRITYANLPFIAVMLAVLLAVIVWPAGMVMSVPRWFGL
ncbi:TRAP transporter large permease [Vreelandella titanicae]|mgnify:CR=1 FL=1|jgi:C4-dicarboxylate transporter DctM subunit|uniref:TRAP transporter large permease n=1 Tax=Halomonadaceae TaxID=28256 RepID=UPI0004885800|nr:MULTISPECIES: TRAP transporter large permease [Halomonas]NAO96282.1 TRAP transporter large permease subunit [Halomonas sp. MG34]KIN15907.1 C4-dicarboxylate ABC transporter permease [Halomonas sp. KHS3]MCD1586635.1 TRAP transporter large permease [Halomonas sp. IOP_14]NVE90334.1 TRAP transporter large permease [Halomonas titanicae]PKH58714.1 TRAP transporter large permease [Halomonas sp. Choline-3u-9]|tara:strand:- start:1419 stop:2699 length:1281 start_codon:yes stop_codon:yes gene_type:complete